MVLYGYLDLLYLVYSSRVLHILAVLGRSLDEVCELGGRALFPKPRTGISLASRGVGRLTNLRQECL